MKYIMISFCVLVLWAITGWWCYGIFQSETFTLSAKYALSAFVAFIGFVISFMAGVFVNIQYPFRKEDEE